MDPLKMLFPIKHGYIPLLYYSLSEVTWFLDLQFSFRWSYPCCNKIRHSFGRRRVFSRFVKTMEVENWVKHDNHRGTHFLLPCTWEDLWKLQACDIFKGWWLMMVHQFGESLGGGVWTTLYISVGMFTTNLNWCGLARFLNYQQWAVRLRYGGPQANYDQYVSWGCSGCHGVPQNLLKIHAFKTAVRIPTLEITNFQIPTETVSFQGSNICWWTFSTSFPTGKWIEQCFVVTQKWWRTHAFC